MGGKAIYYPADELEKFPMAWNNRPVVVYHPTERDDDGNIIPVSANSPEILQREEIGLIFHSWYDEVKRAPKAETWIDEELARRVAPEILSMLMKGEKIEVSTGLFHDIEEVGGVWNGERYDAISRNHRPDHLALLPFGTGACNLQDGCGVFNEKHRDGQSGQAEAALDNGQSGQAVAALDRGGRIVDHQQMMGKMKQIMGRMKSMMDTVMKEMEDMPADMESEMLSKDMKMDKDGMMEKGETVVKGGIDGAALTTNPPEDNQKKEEVPQMEEKKPETLTVNCDTCTKKTAPKANTVSEYVAQAPREIQGVLNRALKREEERKGELIAGIMANERNKFTQEGLTAKDVEELEALASLAGADYREEASAGYNYAGQGGYQANFARNDIGNIPILD